MALIKRVLLFFLSLVGIIVLLVGATTSYAKNEYQADTIEPNFRFYSIEWIDVADTMGRKYVCGTKVSTYDYSGRKYVIEYYYLLKDNNEIVTQFTVDAIQMSVQNPDTAKLEQLELKLYGSMLNKDGKNLLAGMRGDDNDHKGVGAEFSEFDRDGNTKIFKDIYKGDFKLIVHHIPGADVNIPIEENKLYKKENEQVLEDCIVDLLHNQKNRIQSNFLKDNLFSNRLS